MNNSRLKPIYKLLAEMIAKHYLNMAYYRNKFERTGGRKECKHGIQNITLALIVTLHSRLTWYILAQAIPRLVFIQIF